MLVLGKVSGPTSFNKKIVRAFLLYKLHFNHDCHSYVCTRTGFVKSLIACFLRNPKRQLFKYGGTYTKSLRSRRRNATVTGPGRPLLAGARRRRPAADFHENLLTSALNLLLRYFKGYFLFICEAEPLTAGFGMANEEICGRKASNGHVTTSGHGRLITHLFQQYVDYKVTCYEKCDQ
ncbi:hypothetical protein EVAR_82974_1 [Eumeta japonica]|uniref:Uncharacterized protein n=1 Tax=Eumeta variegata TaxID=151549 RepID=A0A4C1VT75_EUMVA|nr:hypothetical protein EVAR_82974_1 [Eumeta japonica]